MQNSGVDYRKEGTFDVVAVLDGTVINVKEDNILGNIVEIRHNNEIISVYQSLSDITVKIDDTVLQGQIIGKSGVNNINKQLKEHLHFELYYKGMVVNPENYFGKNYKNYRLNLPFSFINYIDFPYIKIKGNLMNKNIINRTLKESEYILKTKKPLEKLPKYLVLVKVPFTKIYLIDY